MQVKRHQVEKEEEKRGGTHQRWFYADPAKSQNTAVMHKSALTFSQKEDS
jgi:hypothetical protein